MCVNAKGVATDEYNQFGLQGVAGHDFYNTVKEGFAGDLVIHRSFRAYAAAGLLLRLSRGISGRGMLGAGDAGDPGLVRPSILLCMRELLNGTSSGGGSLGESMKGLGMVHDARICAMGGRMIGMMEPVGLSGGCEPEDDPG